MKKTLVCFFLLWVTFLHAQQESPETIQCSLIEAEMKAHLAVNTKASAGFANDYNLIYQRCEWYVDPAVNAIAGNITSYFKPSVSGFNQLHFDMSDSLKADSVLYHGAVVSVQHAGNIITINLPGTVLPGSMDSLCIFYHGVPSPTGFGSFHQGTHAGAPVIWTLSEPYGARDWWPCKQSLTDKIDSLDVFVTCPSGNLVAGNGVLVSDIPNGNNKTVHWKSRYPVAAYLVAIAVTNYVSYSHYIHLGTGTDSMEILNYVYPEDLAVAQSSTPQIMKTIALYDSLTITYPFHHEKYGHAEFGWGGGMEHQTMSFIGGFSNVLISHECAHQWFGDRVTLGSWHDIWLNEGFATYFEAMTEERYFPENWLSWRINTIKDAMNSPHGSVWVDDTTNVSRIFSGSLSYSKGSYLLHMLRWKLGDDLFFGALRSYLTDTTLAYRYAHTSDLQRHLETISGQNLTGFFNQWFYGKGFPSYQLTWNQSGHSVSITLGQTQSDPSVSFFEMPVQIEFSGEGHDTLIVFNHTCSGQVFNADLNFTAEYVFFDPQFHLLSGNNTVQTKRISGPSASLISIYPNPASGTLQVLNLSPYNPVNRIELYALPGNLIRSVQISGIQNLNNFDLTGIDAGLYELRIKTDLGYIVKKVEVK